MFVLNSRCFGVIEIKVLISCMNVLFNVCNCISIIFYVYLIKIRILYCCIIFLWCGFKNNDFGFILFLI